MGHWFFEFNASLRFILFPDRELVAFHRFHQVFCISFGNLGRSKVLCKWFFELNASLRSTLFPGRELEALHIDSIRFFVFLM